MFDVFQNVLAEIKTQVSDVNYKMWFADIELVSLNEESGVAVIGVPNIFKQTHLKNRYAEMLKTAFEHNNCNVSQVDIRVSTAKNTKVRAHEEINDKTSETTSNDRFVKHIGTKLSSPQLSTGLKPEYTFDNYVVGSSNEVASGVAKLIAKNPGGKYNPFFLYGGPGVGKTHLVQAIGNEIVRTHPDLKVLYITTNHFYSDFVKAIRAEKGTDFANRFRRLDVLIIDDFQMIIGKDRSQEEFFNLFNDLHQANKQIIITSDRLPDQIAELDVRLSSRLAMGGTWDLQFPGFEDRCAIIRSWADYAGQEIEDAAIEYLAENVKTNVRDLNGEFQKLMITAEVRNVSPLELINEGWMSGPTRRQLRNVTPRIVVEKVAKYYGLTVVEMTGKSRVANIKTARQVAMYLLSKELGMSTSKIAPEVGVKDHTTVMNGLKKIEKDKKTNLQLRDQIEQIKEAIYG